MQVLRNPAIQKGFEVCLSFSPAYWNEEQYFHSKTINILGYTLGNSFQVFLTTDYAHKAMGM